MACWYRREADIFAAFNNRPTSAVQVHIRVLAVMHPNLSRSHDNDTVFNSGDVSWASHVTCNDQRARDAFQSQSSERGTLRGGCRHINDTSA